MAKKIYFAGSIRGGRVDADLYNRIIIYIQRTDVVLARNLNTYDILNAKRIFITESALKPIDEILG